MSEPALPRHGLESVFGTLPRTDGKADLVLTIVADLGHINLRGDAESPDFVVAVQTVLEQELPRAANTFTRGPHRVYSLGPDEWLIVTSSADSQFLLRRLREVLSGWHACVTDVSGGQVCLVLDGANAADVLAKGCTLDFHPRSFTTGTCAQSGLARANVLIALHCAPPEPGWPGVDEQSQRGAGVFEIVVRRSFAEYVMLWLNHAGKEFGIRFQVHQAGANP